MLCVTVAHASHSGPPFFLSHSPVVIGVVYDDHSKMLMNYTSQLIIDLRVGPLG